MEGSNRVTSSLRALSSSVRQAQRMCCVTVCHRFVQIDFRPQSSCVAACWRVPLSCLNISRETLIAITASLQRQEQAGVRAGEERERGGIRNLGIL